MPADSTERALTLLSLLSSRASWTGAELAERLAVTGRTVRRDVDRLRSLDYQVDSTGGTDGGYRLRAGAAIPPLFFDEDETIAVVAALLAAIGRQSTGMVDGSTRALGKLHHLLPARLIRMVSAVQQSAVTVPADPTTPQVEPRVVAALAEACRNRIGVRFAYRSRADAHTQRRVEPSSIVTVHSVWYLIGFDVDRQDWRLFRLDRMTDVLATGHGVALRELPGADPLAFVARSLAAAAYQHSAELVVGASSAQLRRLAPWVNAERVEAGAGGSCTVRLGSDSLDDLVAEIVRIVGTAPVRSLTASDAVAAHLSRLRAAITVPGET